jgi:hypothetical protein
VGPMSAKVVAAVSLCSNVRGEVGFAGSPHWQAGPRQRVDVAATERRA